MNGLSEMHEQWELNVAGAFFSAEAEQIRVGHHSKELGSRAECKYLGRWLLLLRLLGNNDNFFKKRCRPFNAIFFFCLFYTNQQCLIPLLNAYYCCIFYNRLKLFTSTKRCSPYRMDY